MKHLALLILPLAIAACSRSSEVRLSASYAAPDATLRVCSGYDCPIEERFSMREADRETITAIMAKGAASPEAERAALRDAIAMMERIARRELRFRPDVRLSWQRHRGKRGQMDCIDESTNTREYLTWMAANGLLKHHTVLRSIAERGLIPGNWHPHKSAQIKAPDGTAWVVDSWKGDDGERPEIMRTAAWRVDSAPAGAYRP